MKALILPFALLISGASVAREGGSALGSCSFYIESSYVLSEVYSKLQSNKIRVVQHASDADYSVRIYATSWDSTCTMLGITYYSCKDYKAGYSLLEMRTGRELGEEKIGEKSFNRMASRAVSRMKKLKCFN